MIWLYGVPPTAAGRVVGVRVIIGAVTVMYPSLVNELMPSILVTVSLTEYVPASKKVNDGFGVPDPN